MAYTKDEALTVIQAFLEKIRQELPIERAYLFGSYATGRNRDYSDIDLAIVTPVLNADNSFAINQKIFSRASRYNLDLEPICFSPEEFEQEYLPIVRDIKREGVEITARDKLNSLTPTLSSKSRKARKSRRVRV
ncbi:MAG: nucleotidyltransferase domain-containing protein [bacterium]